MDFQFRKGTPEDAETFIRFLDEVKAAMVQKDWFYLDPPEAVHAMTQEGTLQFWMAFHEDRLAGVFSILIPGLHPYNYGYDLGFREEELLQVVHMDTAAVHPDFRGHGLQGRMVRLAEQELSGKGKRILLSTVHPENSFSLNNMRAQGYEVQKRVGKYGSERLILQKEIFLKK